MATKPSTPDERQLAIFASHEPKEEFRKAVEVIHSKPSHQLSLLQGKVSNCFIKNAFENPCDEQGWFTISIAKVNRDIGYESNNRAHLRRTIEAMAAILFTYDVLATPEHSKKFGVTALFPTIECDSSDFRYKISDQLRARVLSPEKYALIDMTVLRRFQRTASAGIYEHCARFINVGRTTPVDIATFREIILGKNSGNGAYTEYKYLKKDILKPCIAEINIVSDIFIDPNIVEGKSGRRITSLQFLVSRKVKPEVPLSSDADVAETMEALEEFGLSTSEIRRMLKVHKTGELMAALDYTKKRQADKRAAVLEKPQAYFKQALDKGWAVFDAPANDDQTALDTRVKDEGRKNIEEAFAAHQKEEAKKYLESLDSSEQLICVARYNNQQPLRVLRLTEGKKPHTSATSAFLLWLATDKWGVATESQLLGFAMVMIGKQARKT